MRSSIKKAFHFIGVAAFLTSCAHVPSDGNENHVNISGIASIVDNVDSARTLAISINGASVDSIAGQGFAVSVPEQDVYQIRISGDDVYDSFHTFSHAELDGSNQALTIPEISLVEKKAGRRLLTFGGDAMMGRRYLAPYWNEKVTIHPKTRLKDMKSVLAEMKPYLEIADYAAVNLETILSKSEPDESAPKSVVFYTHPDILKALEWAGVDYVSLGNNHTYDYVDQGLISTLKYLDQSSLGYSGAGMNEDQALKAYEGNLDGVPLKAWGYVGWEGRVSPNQVAEVTKGGAAYGSDDNIISSVSSGAADNQIDIVQYHGSKEYSEGPTESTEGRLKAAIDSGADLAIAHHPHVAQGFEIYQDKLIAYSLGNFAFDQFFYSTHSGLAVNVWMDGDAFYRAEIIPVHVRDYKPVPAMNRTRNYILDRVSRLSADRNTHIGRSGGHGVISSSQQPLTPTIHSGSQDILFVGDFESFDLLGARDRSWFASNASYDAVHQSRTGRFALELKPIKPDETVTFGLKAFMRVFPQADMRLEAFINADTGAKVTAYTQYRPRGVNRYEALDNEPYHKLGEVIVASNVWQDIQFDFKAPNKSQLEARVILKIENGGSSLLLDDFQIVPAAIK